MQAHVGYRLACQMATYALRSARQRALYAGGVTVSLTLCGEAQHEQWKRDTSFPSLPPAAVQPRQKTDPMVVTGSTEQPVVTLCSWILVVVLNHRSRSPRLNAAGRRIECS